MYTYRKKQDIYKKWLQNGQPWFDIDSSKEPSYAEKQVILEMKKQYNAKVKRGLISDKVFDLLDSY